MEEIEARILLKNLVKRIKKDGDGFRLDGPLTDDEFEALNYAVGALGGEPPGAPVASMKVLTTPEGEGPSQRVNDDSSGARIEGSEISVNDASKEPSVYLHMSALELSPAPSDRRVCMDFGTAMSKVTFIRDINEARDFEEIDVLTLGIPGDQEEISETMLVSSVYIDLEGQLHFGNEAVQYSQLEGQDGSRQRIDNVKRFLSEEGLESQVSHVFNPTDIAVTYGDMVLAYLTYLTWAVNQCLEDFGEPANTMRRFALPCFSGVKAKNAEKVMREMLGQAQVLSDTFGDKLPSGLSLNDFSSAAKAVREIDLKCDFIKEEVTEPLGAAGSILSWHEDMNSFQSLVMVIDVGAGTSDFSMFKMGYDRNNKKSHAAPVARSSRGITEAGNHLDKLLKGLILREAGVDSNHEYWINIQGKLELELRDYKERLFIDGSVTVPLFNNQIVTIELSEFMSLPQVQAFSESLRQTRDDILNDINESFIHGAPRDVLSIALTGGGASLPMVKALAEGSVLVKGKQLSLVQTKDFPEWLAEEYYDLESDYSRIAVSLGGARKSIITGGREVSVTAGDLKASPKLEGYYTKGG
ncbi:MAG: hypothetical protein P1U64_11820 [Alcanivoracaceae bacterium]|nr:hypothetical protein [Alcanivoracaceae bacterium]